MRVSAAIVLLALTGCVSAEDTNAWRGRPVAELDRHPIFNAMHMTRRVTADGTEIRDYQNSKVTASCQASGYRTAYGGVNVTEDCQANTPTCHNQFYIKGGIVQAYTPIGSGGAICYTDARARPGFSGPTNFQ